MCSFMTGVVRNFIPMYACASMRVLGDDPVVRTGRCSHATSTYRCFHTQVYQKCTASIRSALRLVNHYVASPCSVKRQPPVQQPVRQPGKRQFDGWFFSFLQFTRNSRGLNNKTQVVSGLDRFLADFRMLFRTNTTFIRFLHSYPPLISCSRIESLWMKCYINGKAYVLPEY